MKTSSSHTMDGMTVLLHNGFIEPTNGLGWHEGYWHLGKNQICGYRISKSLLKNCTKKENAEIINNQENT